MGCPETNFPNKDTPMLKAVLHQKPLQETTVKIRVGRKEEGVKSGTSGF